MAKYESRFAGADNAGLRKQIAKATPGYRCGESNAAAVEAIGRAVALTAQGMATLAQVVADFRAFKGSTACDCDRCTHGN